MHNFLEALHTQRWDDHRYYHHSRINQTLHLLSAFSFLAAYVLLFINPAAAALVAWLVAMVSRQSGHFFSSPRVTTPSTTPLTSTRKRSRWATTSGGRSCCTPSGRCHP